MSLVLWVFGGILSLFGREIRSLTLHHLRDTLLLFLGALSYAELGTAIPKSGGEYAYLMEALHPIFPFLFAWISAWILKPSGVAIISLTCAEYILVPLFNDDCGSPPATNTKMLAITVVREYQVLNTLRVHRLQLVLNSIYWTYLLS